MDIYETWKIYKQKIEDEISRFNGAAKDGDFAKMTTCKDNAKNYYLKFVDLLKTQSKFDQSSFREVLDSFKGDIKQMSDYIKRP